MPPCGVPSSGQTIRPSASKMPAFSHLRISPRNGRSSILSSGIQKVFMGNVIEKALNVSLYYIMVLLSMVQCMAQIPHRVQRPSPGPVAVAAR